MSTAQANAHALTTFALPPSMLDDINAAAGYRRRSAWMREAVEAKLAAEFQEVT